MSARMYRRIAKAAWALHLPNVEAPPGQIDFLLYPWIASNEKIKGELGWTPRYTSRATFVETMRAKGVLREGGDHVAVPPPAVPVA
jgi:hypothetical protein